MGSISNRRRFPGATGASALAIGLLAALVPAEAQYSERGLTLRPTSRTRRN